MKRLFLLLLPVSLLATFSVILVGTSASCPNRDDQTVSFQVSGDCGEPGTLTLSIQQRSCFLEVEADPAMGLPNEGSAWSGQPLEEGGWNLLGSVPAEGDGGVDRISSFCEAALGADGGPLTLVCDRDGRSDCAATLVPES